MEERIRYDLMERGFSQLEILVLAEQRKIPFYFDDEMVLRQIPKIIKESILEVAKRKWEKRKE